MVKELSIAYRSNEYVEYPETITLELSDHQLELINKSINFMKENPNIWSVNVDAFIELDSEEYFKIDASYVIVFPSGRCFVYAQSKWDASVNFESEGFEI